MNNELNISVMDEQNITLLSDDGAQLTSKFNLDKLHFQLLNVFREWISDKKISKRKEFEIFGSLLYKTIFNGDTGAFFEKAINKLLPGNRLRIQLIFHDKAKELASFPWEFLYFPDRETKKGFFLSTNVDLVLSRYIPLETGRQLLKPEEKPLRFLIVVSKPDVLGAVVAEPVIDIIRELSDTEVMVLEKPTIGNLLSKIDNLKPHVVHFFGHGRFNDETKYGEIALLDDDGKNTLWCRDYVFSEFFIQMRSIPRLVFLHLCEGGVNDFGANFAGLAPQLIRANVQAVVAMQYPISNRTAITFSKAFYKEVSKGEPIDNAMQIGRWKITIDENNAYNNRDFGTPILYMHSRDGIINAASDHM